MIAGVYKEDMAVATGSTRLSHTLAELLADWIPNQSYLPLQNDRPGPRRQLKRRHPASRSLVPVAAPYNRAQRG